MRTVPQQRDAGPISAGLPVGAPRAATAPATRAGHVLAGQAAAGQLEDVPSPGDRRQAGAGGLGGPGGPDDTGGSGDGPAGRRLRRRRGRAVRRVLIVLVLLLIVPGISFTRAMTYPGSAPASVRAVEWVRDHGGGGIVNWVENLVFSRNAPPSTGAPSAADRSVPGSAVTVPIPVATAKTVALPKIQLLKGSSAGEGSWHAAGSPGRRGPSLYTAWFRPDPQHTPVVAAAALIPKNAGVLHLAGGTREPVAGLTWPEQYAVPASARKRLVAAFNAGWKTQDARGGWYADGRTAVRLVYGGASLVIHQDGNATVGTWGRDVSMTPDVVAVRQNLALVVQNGRPAQGLTQNANGRWGSPKNQFQFTWRSGIGTDRNGDLIYVAGRGLTLASLATAMQRAGIRTGMELDIHSAMVTFNVFGKQSTGSGPVGHKLLGSMTRPASRYLTSDQRDFFYLTAR